MMLSAPYRILPVMVMTMWIAAAAQVTGSMPAAPAVTANGIVFSDALKGGIFLLNGNGITTISQMPGSGMFYAVSPDGRYVGFKEVQPEGLQSLQMVDATTGKVFTVQEPAAQVGQLSFAANGTKAYTLGTRLIVTLPDGTLRRFELGVYANLAPISPDGNYVVYNDDEDQLWILSLREGGTRRITDGKGSYALPQWSPGGTRIVYQRLSGMMYTYDLSTQRTVMLGEGASPSWFDDHSVIYARQEHEQERLTASDLWLVRCDGSSRTSLTKTKDMLETDPVIDRISSSVIYTDAQREGIFVRTIGPDRTLQPEQEMLSGDRLRRTTPMMEPERLPVSPSTPSAVYFAMPYVHQVWDTPDWYNGHSACGATSSIMVIAYYNIVPEWNVWCSPSGPSPGHYSPYGRYVCEQYTYRELSYSQTANDPNGKPSYGGYGFMWTGSFSPYSRTVDYYTFHGMSAARYDSNASFFQTVIANADSGYPFTLCNGLTTAGHIIVVNGYDANNRTLIVNDPYGNKNTGTYPSLNGKGVKYDWVGYNNGYRNLNRIYWGVSVRAAMRPRADTLVDDAHLNKGFYLHTAAPSSLTQWFDKKSGGHTNGHFWWTRTKSSDTCYAVWTPSLPKDGQYAVEAYIPYSDATKARYRITALDTTHFVIANQKAVKNGWLPLGTFPFAQGTGGSVRLGDGSDTLKQGIIFDAVRWTYVGTLPLSVQHASLMPRSPSLGQNYPNPFNPSTLITFTLPERMTAALTVHDLLGRTVATVDEGMFDAGEHRFTFSADRYGLGTGVYFYSLRTPSSVLTKRMLIVK